MGNSELRKETEAGQAITMRYERACAQSREHLERIVRAVIAFKLASSYKDETDRIVGLWDCGVSQIEYYAWHLLDGGRPEDASCDVPGAPSQREHCGYLVGDEAAGLIEGFVKAAVEEAIYGRNLTPKDARRLVRDQLDYITLTLGYALDVLVPAAPPAAPISPEEEAKFADWRAREGQREKRDLN